MSDLRRKLLSVKPVSRPLIIGHRGSPEHARENTLASFKCAFEEFADGVELDVRITRDGVPVVYHDDALASGEKLADLPLAELRARELQIFTLREVLGHVAGKGYLDIEIKEASLCELIVPLTRQLLPPDSYVYSSFLPGAILQCRELAAEVPAIWIVEDARDFAAHLKQIDQLDATGYAPWYETLSAEISREFTSRGIPLLTFTVNDGDAARRLAGMGVMGIITDRPAELRKSFV